MDRRDFLLLRVTGPRDTELSCERLYMRYVDAEATGTTAALLAVLAADLARTRSVRVTHAEWLVEGKLKGGVEQILSAFAGTGGVVRYQ